MRWCPNCGEHHEDEDFDPQPTGELALGGLPQMSYYWHCKLCRESSDEDFEDRSRERRKRAMDYVI